MTDAARKVSACRSCGAPITWSKTRAGKLAPHDLDGTNHFATCPSSNRHRGRPAPRPVEVPTPERASDADELVESFRRPTIEPDADRAGLRQGVCRRCHATVLRGRALTESRVVDVTVDPHLIPCVRDVHVRLPADPRWPHIQWERIPWYATEYRRFSAVAIADRQAVVLDCHAARHDDEPGRFLARTPHRCPETR